MGKVSKFQDFSEMIFNNIRASFARMIAQMAAEKMFGGLQSSFGSLLGFAETAVGTYNGGSSVVGGGGGNYTGGLPGGTSKIAIDFTQTSGKAVASLSYENDRMNAVPRGR
jgi:hypothetical protein